jgi:Alpha/beta hydrolase domain
MPTPIAEVPHVAPWTKIVLAAALAAVANAPDARVTKIVIDSTTALTGQDSAYEQIRGRAFGTLDPTDPHNAIITDIALGKDGDGKVRYETTFVLTKPVDMAQASGFMWHDVPNRGGAYTIAVAERKLGDVGLASAWQADNAGPTGVPADHTQGSTHWVAVPMAKNADGSLVTGNVLARIVNRSGADSQPLNVMGNPVPYLPASLDTGKATLVTHTHETLDGKVSLGATIPASEWAFAHCNAAHPFPGTPDDIDAAKLPANLPVHVCLKNGFDPKVLYQVVYPAKGAYVLGVGIAAFRDINAFFRYEAADDQGTPNPIAGKIKWAAIRGVSQSGNFTRQYIHLGFNQDESNRIVHEGAWPIIAGRRVAANVRWGQPDGVLELYQLGSEGPQWWVAWPDPVRGLPAKSILDRCSKNQTCPKIFEHFGSAEVYALKMTTEWVGTSANADIPLPANVRRYYVSSTTHGGGAGGFNQDIPDKAVTCPGNNWGQGTFRANPMPEAELVNVLRMAMRNWVMSDTPPPPSRYPTLAAHTLVTPTKNAMGFPSGVPGVADSIFDPHNFVNPVLAYDWGRQFDPNDGTGVPTNIPPPIKRVIAMKVPKVDADGNELGGVPTVLRDAPLGTYLGWNITANGFHQGQTCNYVGGMIPFAVTHAERTANHDPRLSLQERYRDHAGYVAAVRKAADNAMSQGYLLQADHDALIAAAEASNVLRDASIAVGLSDSMGTKR